MHVKRVESALSYVGCEYQCQRAPAGDLRLVWGSWIAMLNCGCGLRKTIEALWPPAYRSPRTLEQTACREKKKGKGPRRVNSTWQFRGEASAGMQTCICTCSCFQAFRNPFTSEIAADRPERTSPSFVSPSPEMENS
jgi:hypothetical protein